MKQLNKGKKRYRVVNVTDRVRLRRSGQLRRGPERVPAINGRLTMRDVILAKVGADIKTRNAKGANYSTFYAR